MSETANYNSSHGEETDDDDEMVAWAAFREDIRSTYTPGDTISGPPQVIEDIDRVDSRIYAEKGLEALANRGVLGDEQDQYRVLQPKSSK